MKLFPLRDFLFRGGIVRNALGCCIAAMISSCTENQPASLGGIQSDSVEVFVDTVTPELPLPATQENFNSFLRFFKRSDSYRHWPDSVQVRLWNDPDFVDWKKGEEVVSRYMTHIPPQYGSFLPLEPIKSAVENYPVPDPLSSYAFFAFEKVDLGDFWLTGIYAFKTPYKEKEYHQHHFFLSTYAKSGRKISEYLWWGDIVDDLELSTYEAAVFADTLIAGYMGNPAERIYDEIYLKVLLRPDGTFDTVYYHPPEPSMF